MLVDPTQYGQIPLASGHIGDRVRTYRPIKLPPQIIKQILMREPQAAQLSPEQERIERARLRNATDPNNQGVSPESQLLGLSSTLVNSGAFFGDPSGRAKAEILLRSALAANPQAAAGYTTTVPTSGINNEMLVKGAQHTGGGFGKDIPRNAGAQSIQDNAAYLDLMDKLLSLGEHTRNFGS